MADSAALDGRASDDTTGVPDAVRDAVERTVQATAGSAETRARPRPGRGRRPRRGRRGRLVKEAGETRRETAARRSTSACPPPRTTSRSCAPSCARSSRRLDAIEAAPAAEARKREGSTAKPQAEPKPAEARLGQVRQGRADVAGRRVLITGVGELTSAPSSRGGSRPTRTSSTSPASTRARPRAGLERTELHRGRHPRPGDRQPDRRSAGSTPSCTTRSCAGPGPGMSAGTMHDINVIGIAPAADRLRAVADASRRS